MHGFCIVYGYRYGRCASQITLAWPSTHSQLLPHWPCICSVLIHPRGPGATAEAGAGRRGEECIRFSLCSRMMQLAAAVLKSGLQTASRRGVLQSYCRCMLLCALVRCRADSAVLTVSLITAFVFEPRWFTCSLLGLCTGRAIYQAYFSWWLISELCTLVLPKGCS